MWTKSYDVTIQMKGLCLYFHMELFFFKFHKMKIWKFGRNLLLAKFGSDRVKVSRLGMAVWAEVTSLHEPLLF